MRTTPRRTVGALVGLGAAALGLGLASVADARPTMSSFYARDEGGIIQLRVNFCDYTGRTSDSFSVVFRMWSEDTGYQVLNRRVSGRLWDRCGSAYLKIPDTFPVGDYSANAAVVNRTRGGSVRNQARIFYIS